MPGYIEKEKALLVFGEVHPLDYNTAGYASKIRSIPAADVAEVRHGRWHDVYLSIAPSFVGTCSVCGKSNDIPPVPLAKYCPNCGAKMDGGQDE